MLKDAKPKLQDDIEGILKDAIYEAYMTQYKESDNTIINSFTKNSMSTAAKEFSEKASKLIGKPLAEAIYNFVLEIGITAKPNQLVAPNGPVSGVININEFSIS